MIVGKSMRVGKWCALFCCGMALSLPLLAGCQSGETAGNKAGSQQQMADRLGEIVRKSGGDWEKLSPEDKNYLVNDLSGGDEQSARMTLRAKAGKLRLNAPPPGPPRVGAGPPRSAQH